MEAWEDVEEEADWNTLLLGNGFSVNVSAGFDYPNLFDHASAESLGADDHALFDALATTNFELVLSDLLAAIRVADALGSPTDELFERYRSVQASLGHAVRGMHLEWRDARGSVLEAIGDHLTAYHSVFTTGYDLLVYWAMGATGSYESFRDFFFAWNVNGFDPSFCAPSNSCTNVYYLHGALHLIVDGDGDTLKRVQDHRTLLEQFGEPIPDDPYARPLLVTEGSPQQKIAAIGSNAYLSTALSRFRKRSDPLVVFGHSLGATDEHLVEAINLHSERPVAVSVRAGDSAVVAQTERLVRARLITEELHFFDAATFPLGSPAFSHA